MGRMGPWLRKGTSASGPSRPTSQQEAESRGSPILFGHLSGEGSTSRGARVGGSREADLSELMPGRSWADRGSGGPLILEAGRVSATFLVASHFLLGPSGMALSDPGVLQEPGHQSPSRVRAAEGGTHEAKSVKPERFFFFLVLRAACGAYRNFQGRG